MKDRGTSALFGAGLGMLLLGCAGADTARPELVVSDSAGVEIVQLQELPSLLDERWRWGLKLRRSIATERPGSDAPILYDPSTPMPLSNGRLLVADDAGDELLVVLDARDGTVISRFGSKGEGPGELSGAGMMVWETPDGLIDIVDRGNARMVTFSADGQLLHERSVPMIPRGGVGGAARRGGGVIMEKWDFSLAAPPVLTLVSLEPEGTSLETWVELPRHPVGWKPGEIQDGRPEWTLVDAGAVTARTDLPVFRIYDVEGAMTREIRLPLTRRSLSETDVAAMNRKYPDMPSLWKPGPIAIGNSIIPWGDTAFATYHGWFFRAAEDPVIAEDTTAWRIVSVHGSYMGSLVVPQEFFPVGRIGEGTLWRVGADSLGIPVLQEFELEPPPALRD